MTSFVLQPFEMCFVFLQHISGIGRLSLSDGTLVYDSNKRLTFKTFPRHSSLFLIFSCFLYYISGTDSDVGIEVDLLVISLLEEKSCKTKALSTII